VEFGDGGIQEIEEQDRFLEFLGQASLFQDGVGSVTRLDYTVNDQAYSGDRTEPYLMITFALALKPAPGSMQIPFQRRGKIRH
jgi:hypothetical protein